MIDVLRGYRHSHHQRIDRPSAIWRTIVPALCALVLLSSASRAQPLWQRLPDGISGPVDEASDGSLIAGYGGIIHRSTDNGTTWTVAGNVSDGYLAAIDSSGAFYSIREQRIQFPPAPEYPVYHLSRSDDGGSSWRGVATGVQAPAFDLTRPDMLAAGFSGPSPMGGLRGGGVMVSTDSGRNWRRTDLQLATSRVAVTPKGTLLAAVFEIEESDWIRRLYVSRDTGATWEMLFDSLGTQIVSVASNGTIYMTGRDYSIDSLSGYPSERRVFRRSTDDGHSWEEIDITGPISQLFITPADEVYLSVDHLRRTPESLYSSDDGGTWNPVSPTPGWSIPDFLETLPNGDIIARGDSNLYRSSDNGTTWISMQFNLPLSQHTTLLATHNGYLFANGPGGLYRLSAERLHAGSAEPAGIAGLFIESVRPSPLVGSSVVSVTLGSPMHLRITLCDLLGREQRQLHDGLLPTGTNTLQIERGELPAGVYVLVVRSVDGVASRRIVIRR